MNRKTNKELNAFRGFTLIELLAVIVVLAIIILIAVNAVLPQMENARRSSFAIEANSAIDAAQAYFMNADLIGGEGNQGLPSTSGGDACVSIDDLISGGYSDLDPKKYDGYVYVIKGIKGTDNENRYFYKIWISKEQKMMVNGKGYSGTGAAQENVDITLEHVEDYNAGTWTKETDNTLPAKCTS